MKGTRVRTEAHAMERHGSRRDRHPRLSFDLQSLTRSIRRANDVFWSALREIFDESAYARFLDRQKLLSSPHAYAAFLRENQRQRETRPRCC
jgi:hypothetical protein